MEVTSVQLEGWPGFLSGSDVAVTERLALWVAHRVDYRNLKQLFEYLTT